MSCLTALSAASGAGMSRLTTLSARSGAGMSRLTALSARSGAGMSRLTAHSARSGAGMSRVTAHSAASGAGISRLTAHSAASGAGMSRLTAHSARSVAAWDSLAGPGQHVEIECAGPAAAWCLSPQAGERVATTCRMLTTSAAHSPVTYWALTGRVADRRDHAGTWIQISGAPVSPSVSRYLVLAP